MKTPQRAYKTSIGTSTIRANQLRPADVTQHGFEGQFSVSAGRGPLIALKEAEAARLGQIVPTINIAARKDRSYCTGMSGGKQDRNGRRYSDGGLRRVAPMASTTM